MKKIGKLGRRHFLLGAGGFTLALPVLPSLLTETARAQVRQNKRFVAIASTHGGAAAADMFPPDAAAPQTEPLFPGHVAHHGPLPYSTSGGVASITRVLRGSEGVLTPALASKLNVVRGLGIMQYMGHHHGGHLGSIGETGVPTIDQVLAWSDRFYPDLSGVLERSIQIDSDRNGNGLAWGFTDPATRSGAIVGLPAEQSSIGLFDRLFGDVGATAPSEPRRPVVDRVLDHYRAMTSGRFGDAQRLSAADRRRLEEHMQRISELQRRLESRAAVSCGQLTRPGNSAGFTRADDVRLQVRPVAEAQNAQWFALFNDVLATAIMCNVTSVATIYPRAILVDGVNQSDWHESVAHAGDSATLGQQASRVFEHVFLDLVSKLDVEEMDGRTFLDNSLVQYTQESGFLTHFSLEMPLVTAGSAGGHFRTGRFIDYRYRESTLLPARHWSGLKAEFREGLSWNQYLANVLMAMGLRPQDFGDTTPGPGYGDMTVEARHAAGYHQGIVDAGGDPLPMLVA